LVLGIFAVIVAGCTSRTQLSYEPRPDLGQYFEVEGVTGTIVIQAIHAPQVPVVYDIARARRDHPPAQTFKILSTLVALESNAVASLDTEIVWDGNGPVVPRWDRVHTLRSSIEPSGYWFTDAVIDRIGFDTTEVWINRTNYGNQNIRGSFDRFWLDGTLTIDAIQQAEFMSLIWSDDHPFDRYAAFDVKDILSVEEGDGWIIQYITANTTGAEPVRWLVGAVITGGGTWGVAMNIDNPIGTPIDIDQPLRITKAVLVGAGVIQAS
jgi:beta-lactamase class D